MNAAKPTESPPNFPRISQRSELTEVALAKRFAQIAAPIPFHHNAADAVAMAPALAPEETICMDSQLGLGKALSSSSSVSMSRSRISGSRKLVL